MFLIFLLCSPWGPKDFRSQITSPPLRCGRVHCIGINRKWMRSEDGVGGDLSFMVGVCHMVKREVAIESVFLLELTFNVNVDPIRVSDYFGASRGRMACPCNETRSIWVSQKGARGAYSSHARTSVFQTLLWLNEALCSSGFPQI